MTFPDFIPATGPCVLADGVLFVPGMPVYRARPLGESHLFEADTSCWEPYKVLRRHRRHDWHSGWTLEEEEWVLYHVEGTMIGAAAIFVSRPVGIAPEFI